MEHETVCQHGQLRRQCEICEANRERDALKAEVERLRKAARPVYMRLMDISGGGCPLCGAGFDCDCAEGCPFEKWVASWEAERKEATDE